MTLDRPIFITGVQRSGTTLLRTILCAHPDIWVAYECAAYKLAIKGFENGIARTQIPAFMDQLYQVRRFSHWNIDRSEAEAAFLETKQDTVSFRWAMDTLAQLNIAGSKPTASRFGYKNPHGIYHLPYIWSLYPDALVINIMRDPRGILASEKSRRLKGAGYQPASTIQTVAKRFQRMAQAHDAAKDDPRYLSLRYADLLRDFEGTIEQVLEFAQVPFRHEVQTYDQNAKDNALTPASEMHLHALTLNRPDPQRIYAFRDTLTSLEQTALEARCAPLMARLLDEQPDHGPTARAVATARFWPKLLREKLSHRV